jgi:hypothetical protein
MGYLPDREHDVFVSYAHDDNLHGWVTDFAKLLEKELSRQLKIKEDARDRIDVRIWHDDQLPRQGELRDRLGEATGTSSTLLAVMSRSYLLSDWCKEEIAMFLRSLSDQGRARLFIIEKEETDRDKWPSFLKGRDGKPLLAEPFFHEDGVGKVRTLPIKTAQGSLNPVAQPHLEDLANDLSNYLYGLRRHPVAVAGPPGAKSVFLALTPEGVASRYRRLVQTHLEKRRDVVVLPGGVGSSANVEATIRDQMARASLVIQILDQSVGLFGTNHPMGLVGFQHQLAAERRIPIVQWLVPELAQGIDSVENPNYADFLRGLGSRPPLEKTTLVQGELDDLLAELSKILDESEGGDLPSAGEHAETRFIAVKCLLGDESYASEVVKAIRAATGKHRFGTFLLGPRSGPRDAQAMTRLARGLVVVWGESDLEWVVGTIADLERGPATQRKKKALAVFTPPHCGAEPELPTATSLYFESTNAGSSRSARNLAEYLTAVAADVGT